MVEQIRNDSSTKNTNGSSGIYSNNNHHHHKQQQQQASRIRDRCHREKMTTRTTTTTSLLSSSSPPPSATKGTIITRTRRSKLQGAPTTATMMTVTGTAVVGFGLVVLVVWVGLSVYLTVYYLLPASSGTTTNSNIHNTHCSSPLPPPDGGPELQNSLLHPPPTTSLPPPPPFHIFHTVTSRFMVGQPDQPTLARARYELFETFCFPTVTHQTRQNFFWLVLVDPRIDEQVLADLERLLSQQPQQQQQNAFMVLTQNPVWAADGVGVPGVDSYGVSLQELAREYEAGRVEIRTGNVTLLLEALDVIEDRLGHQNQNQNRNRSGSRSRNSNSQRWIDTNDDVDESSSSLILLIETLLDADDGLHTSGIQRIQDEAVQHSIRQLELLGANSNSIVHGDRGIEQPTISLNSTWWLMCGIDHIEWHNRDIYQMTKKEYEEQGLSSGITGLRHAPVYCASAGYTRVGLTTPVSVRRDQHEDDETTTATTTANKDRNKNETSTLLLFPRVAYSNHALTADFPVCNDALDLDGREDAVSEYKILGRILFFMPSITARKEDSSSSSSKNNNNENEAIVSKCFRRVFPNLPYVLKSRTITSDSMDHISVKQKDYRDLPWQNKSEYPLLINETEKTWRILQSDFHISRLKAWKTSIFLRENMEAILKENSAARCAPGFPCREVADAQFKRVGMFVKGLKRKDAYEEKKLPKRTN